MGNRDWLKNLKVGDEFYTENSMGYNIHKVKRLTKTEIITEGRDEKGEGSRFSRENGKSIGTSQWYHNWAQELTPEIKPKIRAKNIAGYLSKFKFGELSNEKLDKLYQVIKGN